MIPGADSVLRVILCVCVCVAGAAGCGKAERDRGAASVDDRFIALNLERHESEDLIGYYLSGYLASGERDPFESRLVVKQGDSYFVDVDLLAVADSLSAVYLNAAAGHDRALDWNAFSQFVTDTYFRVRRIPQDRSSLDAEEGFDRDDPAWMSVTAVGVMSTHIRRVYVRQETVVHALRSYRESEDRIIYPPGTTFVGEHLDGDTITETTVMRKSDGGRWDFFAYDAAGHLADSTLAMPRSRKVPTQCFGCHFGDKLYEPARSFPGRAADGPHGPRAVFVDDALRDAEIVRYFDEHRQRSDGVLGLYATVLVSGMREQRRAGQLDRPMMDLLDSLGL